MRIGIGYDVHQLTPDRPLWLGGVLIPHHLGLLGHSDADVLIHAICDALLGAAALGDIGKHFPDKDPQYKGIDSKILLRCCGELLQREGYTIANIDSIVVAPILSLSEKDKKMLNDSAIKIIRELKIEGGCNVQFALHPETSEYYLIEVNPRVSRSSALASKASGYPIARVTAKIALGMALEEIPVAGGTAAIEPSLDYVVAKFPRFPFDKFPAAPNTLGTQMKATGEVMGIGSTLEECFLKSVRSLETGVCHFYSPKFDPMTEEELFAYIVHRKAARDNNDHGAFPRIAAADRRDGESAENEGQRYRNPARRQEDGLFRQVHLQTLEPQRGGAV